MVFTLCLLITDEVLSRRPDLENAVVDHVDVSIQQIFGTTGKEPFCRLQGFSYWKFPHQVTKTPQARSDQIVSGEKYAVLTLNPGYV
jgi:hypothetical protein